ncbi:hypothetical protein Syun_017998 [Stephania yunnanensis]|uniref:Uncharacterized protein n=1 Tax=Stephania yunnanensis TaxID=152371 RepID=A0AAP0IRJ4_9MAGN
MKPRANQTARAPKSNSYQGQGPNWILIAGGALLSTLSIRLGYKIKQALDMKRTDSASSSPTGGVISDGKSSENKRQGACTLHTNMYSFAQDEDGCYNYLSVSDLDLETGMSESILDVKHQPNGQTLKATDSSLPLVAITAPETNRENGVMWSSSPDRLELPRKPFHHSNSSDSPCVSESGSDIFTKREVIHKLRQQLKRRDEMILEMQDQIIELQNSLSSQMTHSTVLQTQLDAAHQDLFDSEREIQRLRKAIADHCAGEVNQPEKPAVARNWSADGRNGHFHGFLDTENDFKFAEKGKDGERIEMLKREVGELKEVIDGKEYLLQSYKEQSSELSLKIKELQHRLASQFQCLKLYSLCVLCVSIRADDRKDHRGTAELNSKLGLVN